LIIAGLMTGLAVGSGKNISFLNSFSLRRKALFLMIFYLGFGLIFNYVIEIKSGLPVVALIVFSVFLPGLLTGHVFRELTINTKVTETSPETYSADLAGSALGFILISGFAVPLFGIQFAIFLLSLLIFAGILFGTIINKS
jgi:hypothetical protein